MSQENVEAMGSSQTPAFDSGPLTRCPNGAMIG